LRGGEFNVGVDMKRLSSRRMGDVTVVVGLVVVTS
jgi:hypothetical protein